jgi:hypothetical protein
LDCSEGFHFDAGNVNLDQIFGFTWTTFGQDYHKGGTPREIGYLLDPLYPQPSKSTISVRQLMHRILDVRCVSLVRWGHIAIRYLVYSTLSWQHSYIVTTE